MDGTDYGFQLQVGAKPLKEDGWLVIASFECPSSHPRRKKTLGGNYSFLRVSPSVLEHDLNGGLDFFSLWEENRRRVKEIKLDYWGFSQRWLKYPKPLIK